MQRIVRSIQEKKILEKSLAALEAAKDQIGCASNAREIADSILARVWTENGMEEGRAYLASSGIPNTEDWNCAGLQAPYLYVHLGDRLERITGKDSIMEEIPEWLQEVIRQQWRYVPFV